MATQVRLPELGENIASVTVVNILVKVGDEITVDQSLIEVESEKAAVEIPASVAGTITKILVKAGDTIEVGQAIVSIEPAAAGEADDEQAAAPEQPSPAGPDKHQHDTEPPDEAPGPASPDEQMLADEDASTALAPRAPDRQAAWVIPNPRTAAGSAPIEPRPPALAPRWQADQGQRRLVPAAPSVRRFAREVGVDISEVPGSGPGGRVTTEDVKARAKQHLSRVPSGAGPAPQPLPDFGRWGEVEEQQMSSIRRITAQQMARAWALVPQVTHHDVCDITRLEATRERFSRRAEAAGARLTVTSILAKVAASALKLFPHLNASIDVDRELVILKRYIHVGIAVDTANGLLVPVIRDADRKSIIDIARELDDLASRARARKLSPDELQGASFTISNLGGIGGTGFSPIVNWPQAAILGVSRAQQQVVWAQGQAEPRLILPLSLSYDHRLVDGADAARFLRWISEALEEPLLLELGV